LKYTLLVELANANSGIGYGNMQAFLVLACRNSNAAFLSVFKAVSNEVLQDFFEV